MQETKPSRLEEWTFLELACREEYYSAHQEAPPPLNPADCAAALSKKYYMPNCSNHLIESDFFLPEQSIALVKHPRYLALDYHAHDFYEMIYVYQGGCVNVLEKTKLHMKAGDLCILPPNQIHKLLSFRDEEISVNILIRKSTFWQTFHPLLSKLGLLSTFFSHTLFQKENSAYLLFRCGEDAAIRQQIQAMYKEYIVADPFSSCILAGQLMSLFGTLMRSHQQDVLQFYSKKSQSAIQITSLLQYISDHCRDITLQEVAQKFNYSHSRCSTIIKEATGKSFTTLIREAKARLAAQMFLSGGYSINQIAEQCGFYDTSHLYRTFSAVYGMTPAQYQQTHRDAIPEAAPK